ncbi:MAG: DUF3566 domain-containing protein [Opitutaceae bacterium]
MNPPTIAIKRRIKRVSPLQLGKILALLYGIIGLIAIPFFLFIASVSAQLPPDQQAPFMAMGAGAALFAPILYAVVGFIIGVIGAVIYNLVARWVGGIEVEVE